MKFLVQRELASVCIFWCIFHQCDENNLNYLIVAFNISKAWPGRSWSAFFFFFLYINRCLTIEYLLKKCMTEELPCGSFFSNEEIHANLSREKPFLFCVNEEIYIRFRKFSERTNVEWNFIFFTLASQCKLCGLLNYGKYSHLFISVVCFLKTTHLSVHRFNSLIFFSCRIKSTHIIFLLLKNTDHSNRVLKTLKNIYLNKFQSKESLPWDWLWKSTKLENCKKPLCKGFVKNESL